MRPFLLVVLAACGTHDTSAADAQMGTTDGRATADAGAGAADATTAPVPAILNGSFEHTSLSVACHSNLSNAELTEAVDHVTAFGAYDQPDLYIDGCYGSESSDGTFHVGLGATTVTDAIALELSTPLTAGVRYRIRFMAHHGETGGATSTVVELGVSTQPTSFGVLIGSTPQLPAAPPSPYTFDHIATTAATYVTLRVAIDGDLGWAMIDDVRLEPVE